MLTKSVIHRMVFDDFVPYPVKIRQASYERYRKVWNEYHARGVSFAVLAKEKGLSKARIESMVNSHERLLKRNNGVDKAPIEYWIEELEEAHKKAGERLEAIKEAYLTPTL